MVVVEASGMTVRLIIIDDDGELLLREFADCRLRKRDGFFVAVSDATDEAICFVRSECCLSAERSA